MPISSVFQVVSPDPQQVQSIVTTLNGYVTTTAASEAAAATSATNAAVSETSAAASAASALTSKNAAVQSAISVGADAAAAATSATNAAASASTASADATQTAADRVQTGLDRVATAADAVQTAADRVQTGLDVTSSSASAAAALSSRNAAATSETNAAASATSSSADATATAADRVQTGLDRTATNADAIATAADRVQTGLDVTAAGTSATNAATSASAAASDATAAAASAASAANSYDLFDDRYLGSKTGYATAQTGPALDNDGNALVAGTLFFSADANEMRVYDGAGWIAASSAGSSSLNNYHYTATAAQTTFSGADDNSNTLSYTVDNLIVTKNGIVLEDGTDYTATNGTSVVLAVAAAVNDEINIVAFKSFTTADMVSATNGGTFQGNVDFAAGADVTGNITVTGTVDGRDVATDGTKLDGIEALADVTDTANVTAAGAAMLTGANFTGNVDVTGTVQGDALVIDGNSVFNGNAFIDQGAISGNTLSLDRTGADGTLGFFNSGTQTGLISGVSGGGINAYVGSTPSLAMAISSAGNVGVGTASPTKKVSASIGLNDTDGFALEYSGEAKAGMLVVPATGEVRMGAINSTGTYFSTFYANNSEAMRVDSSGNVRINTSSSTGHRLQVEDVTDVASFRATSSNSGQESLIQFKKNGSEVGYINVTTSSTVYGTSSDYRLKENVTADWDATTRLKQLNPVRFNFIADADTTVDGFLAHEVQDVVPEAISGTKDEVDEDGNPVMQGIDQSKIVPLLVKTIQELEARITALETA